MVRRKDVVQRGWRRGAGGDRVSSLWPRLLPVATQGMGETTQCHVFHLQCTVTPDPPLGSPLPTEWADVLGSGSGHQLTTGYFLAPEAPWLAQWEWASPAMVEQPCPVGAGAEQAQCPLATSHLPAATLVRHLTCANVCVHTRLSATRGSVLCAGLAPSAPAGPLTPARDRNSPFTVPGLL